MTNFVFYASPSVTLVCVPSTPASAYSLETAAELTEVHPDLIRHYCQLGLLGAQNDKQDPVFTARGLAVIRRIEHFRSIGGANLAALPLICRLFDQVERLQLALDLRVALESGNRPMARFT